jgi:hypothetical protein
MANALYPKTKAQLLQGAINLLTADVRLILVDTGAYTYDAGACVPLRRAVRARTAVSSSLTGKSIDEATSAFKSDEKTFSSVSGVESEALIGYIHTGTAATSRLIWFQDTGVTGLPVTPDGRDIKVTPAAARGGGSDMHPIPMR